LFSQTVVTDGRWRHIGFVWDGSHRFLYVDGSEVAADTYPISGLESAIAGLHIGTDTTHSQAGCWSGLIDDVRIYDRALGPDEVAALAY
jgi:hypothetical protein